MNLTFYTDPGHGWLCVPKSLVQEWDLRISPYSYDGDDVLFLEEDLDATTFMSAAKAHDIDVTFVESHTNGDSFIRNKPPWRDDRWVSPFA